jgi:hypothetical protein
MAARNGSGNTVQGLNPDGIAFSPQGRQQVSIHNFI